MVRYLKYKDSGVNWIGKIPKDWNVLRIKWLSPVKRGASPRPIADPMYFDEDGEFAWVRIADVTASDKYLEQTTQTLSELGSSLSVKQYPGNFFVSIAGTVGKPIITKIKCCIHDGFVWFPNLSKNTLFFFYMFSAGELYKGLGKWGTQLNLNTETIGDIYVPIPSGKDIQRIEVYLEKKTQLIDTLIEKKQKQIELLIEQRAATINQTVTKGLDPNVKMKDSGIEWLGQVPEHWEVSKLKYVSIINPSKNTSTVTNYSDELVTFLPMEKVSVNGTYDNSLKMPTNELWNGFTYFEKNDVIVAKITPCFENGKAALLNDLGSEYGFGSTEFHVLRSMENKIIPKFLYYIIHSPLFMNTGEAFMTGAAGQKRVPTSFVEDFLIGIPSIEEQGEIVDHIGYQHRIVDELIRTFSRHIELLKEYRTTLISEVVTGKIDVRDEVIP